MSSFIQHTTMVKPYSEVVIHFMKHIDEHKSLPPPPHNSETALSPSEDLGLHSRHPKIAKCHWKHSRTKGRNYSG